MSIRPTVLIVTTACMMASAINIGHAAGAAKKSMDKVTCEEFLGLDETYQPMYVAWAWGYNYGQSDPTAAWVDVDGVKEITPYVVTECEKEPKASFWSKVKSKFHK
ncbi:HdeA/HdeB family chaperone [Povalibacter sp.]|uniref:HdeA/HdeB family chaperone n=1 Tax=Povalibacter sp. TaxID=1962978 RepID=UPI002F403F53